MKMQTHNTNKFGKNPRFLLSFIENLDLFLSLGFSSTGNSYVSLSANAMEGYRRVKRRPKSSNDCRQLINSIGKMKMTKHLARMASAIKTMGEMG